MSVASLQFLLLVFAGWVNRRQIDVIEAHFGEIVATDWMVARPPTGAAAVAQPVASVESGR